MITKQINGKEYLFVPVPEDAIDFSFDKFRNHISATIEHKMDEAFNSDWFSETLPEGNYTIIGKGDTLSEEQWNEFIGGTPYPNFVNQNILDPNFKSLWFQTATESGLSLIKSIGMKPETTLVIIKNANP